MLDTKLDGRMDLKLADVGKNWPNNVPRNRVNLEDILLPIFLSVPAINWGVRLENWAKKLA